MAALTAKAHWVDRDTIGWTGAEPSSTYRLYHSLTGGLAAQIADGKLLGAFVPLVVDRNGLGQPILDKFPFLKGATSLKISERDSGQIQELLQGELIVAQMNGAKTLVFTSLQIGGVLDDLFYFDGELGAQPSEGGVRFRLWAPTARRVRLCIDDRPEGVEREIYSLAKAEAGVWEVTAGDTSWLNTKYYLYEVEVYSRLEGRVVTNLITDPYSLGLAPNSLQSLIVDLNSAPSKPDSWGLISKPDLASPTDIVLYELHIRDFSIFDETVPEKDRGKYAAFAHLFSNGMLHLWSLAQAGLTHVHLLPAFDFTSVPELTEEQKVPQIDLAISAPDSPEPQRAIAAVKDQDAYNWGYDPWHYATPEG
ncbi:MAG: DUF3372 domain-containing protein, partial [Verrucomicrobia bacterium]|nr:DUF3372 domain-containing protein [Verrucomicrobiota bacterium]